MEKRNFWFTRATDLRYWLATSKSFERELDARIGRILVGAAIAPPTALIEQDKKVLEEPAPIPEPASFTPKFGSGSKGCVFDWSSSLG